MKITDSINAIIREHERAASLYHSFHSNHEGYAVLKEEMDELWDEIKNNKDTRGNDKIRNELIQIGAMAIRFLNDLC
jgi:hypothetical protein